MSRLAAMVRRLKSKLDDIHVTLDSRHFIHIAHPIFWKDSKGDRPPVFTKISRAEVEGGAWSPTMPGMYRRALDYVRKIEQNGRYELTIWPPHCLIGSPGHTVFPELFSALTEWEKRFAVVDYVTKWTRLLGRTCKQRPIRPLASILCGSDW